MPRCGKNVFNQWIDGGVWCGYERGKLLLTTPRVAAHSEKPQLSAALSIAFPALFNMRPAYFSPPLSGQLSPLSTAPIITTKESKRKDNSNEA